MAKAAVKKTEPKTVEDQLSAMSEKEILSMCHGSCRRSQNLGPFAMCKCRCGGRSHGSDTLGEMTSFARRRAEAKMKQEVHEGEALMQIRIYLAGIKAGWKK